MDTVERFVTIGFNRPFRINGDIELLLSRSGTCWAPPRQYLKINDHGEEKTIAFTGDIGRKNYPVLERPGAIAACGLPGLRINLWRPHAYQR